LLQVIACSGIALMFGVKVVMIVALMNSLRRGWFTCHAQQAWRTDFAARINIASLQFILRSGACGTVV